MKKINKKEILLYIPYVLIFYLVNQYLYALSVSTYQTMEEKILNEFVNIGVTIKQHPFPSFNMEHILYSCIAALAAKFYIDYRKKNAKKYRKGEEYGSARWAEVKEILPYMNKVFSQNIILTKTEGLNIKNPTKFKYRRNKNVKITGTSGTGKTDSYVVPNILQMNTSFVVTDPKGTILPRVGKALLRGPMIHKNGQMVNQPYKIKVFNTVNFKKSMHYNPFEYIQSEKDILKLVNAIIMNTNGDGENSKEDFWVKSERLLFTSYIAFIHYELPKEEQHIGTLLKMLDDSQTSEADENYKNVIDVMFDDLEDDSFAKRQYKKYKLAAGKTAKSILISCGARLAPFDIKEVREIMQYDELELDKIGDRLTALFIIVSDTDYTFNFIISLIYTQIFNLLCERADDLYGGVLPYPVHCILDEFANIGEVPNFKRLISTIRSRGIFASIILQSDRQLKDTYKDAAETIIDNCDTELFLGGRSRTTTKNINESLGKETIDVMNTSDTRGNQRSYGTNFQKLGKSLMAQDEVALMDGEKCILQIRGIRPFFSDKYDLKQHPNYHLLSDYSKENYFDIISYLDLKLKLKKTDKVTVVDCD